MSAPRPSLTPSRLNVGGYGVTIRAYVDVSTLDLTFDEGGFFTAADLTGWVCWGRGVITSKTELTVIPQAWHARHYRRAVMNGAGVYRLGLWAYLGARRGLTVPQAGATVEPHRVTVRGQQRIDPHLWRQMGGDWAGPGARGIHVTVPHIDAGRVNASGALSLAGQRQRAVYYRQSCMRGAGVYQAGLWAMLAPSSPTEGGATLGGNDAATLARFTLTAHGRVRHSIRWRSSKTTRQKMVAYEFHNQGYKVNLRRYYSRGGFKRLKRDNFVGLLTSKSDRGFNDIAVRFECGNVYIDDHLEDISQSQILSLRSKLIGRGFANNDGKIENLFFKSICLLLFAARQEYKVLARLKMPEVKAQTLSS